MAMAAPAIGSFFGMPPLERIVPVLAVLIPIQERAAEPAGPLPTNGAGSM
jgi:hypothetical protein